MMISDEEILIWGTEIVDDRVGRWFGINRFFSANRNYLVLGHTLLQQLIRSLNSASVEVTE